MYQYFQTFQFLPKLYSCYIHAILNICVTDFQWFGLYGSICINEWQDIYIYVHIYYIYIHIYKYKYIYIYMYIYINVNTYIYIYIYIYIINIKSKFFPPSLVLQSQNYEYCLLSTIVKHTVNFPLKKKKILKLFPTSPYHYHQRYHQA